MFYVVMLLSWLKQQKTTPQKSGSTSVHFEHDQLCLHVQKLLVIGGESSCFAFLVPKHYKNRFLRISKTRFSAFLVKKSRSITWPP